MTRIEQTFTDQTKISGYLSDRRYQCSNFISSVDFNSSVSVNNRIKLNQIAKIFAL